MKKQTVLKIKMGLYIAGLLASGWGAARLKDYAQRAKEEVKKEEAKEAPKKEEGQ